MQLLVGMLLLTPLRLLLLMTLLLLLPFDWVAYVTVGRAASTWAAAVAAPAYFTKGIRGEILDVTFTRFPSKSIQNERSA
jgi:hypothetical protein